MKAVIILCLAACAFALTFKNDPFWVAYKQNFGKSYYSAEEEARRYEIFNKNMARAAELNEIDTATYGWNAHSDRVRRHSRIDIPKDIERVSLTVPKSLPSSFDWRKKGAVNPIKDQEQCGSCWAFSAVVALEGAYFLEHNKLLSFSEQQIVDCDKDDDGCDGGWPSSALEYLEKHGGIMLESDYKYKAHDESCKFDKSKAKMQIKQIKSFTARKEAEMMTGIQQYGPLSVCLDASKFDNYNGGIMNGKGCSASDIDHCVGVVGWGEEGSTKYWIIRNSWGKDWGESGYVRMQRGINACGIEDYPVGVVSK